MDPTDCKNHQVPFSCGSTYEACFWEGGLRGRSTTSLWAHSKWVAGCCRQLLLALKFHVRMTSEWDAVGNGLLIAPTLSRRLRLLNHPPTLVQCLSAISSLA